MAQTNELVEALRGLCNAIDKARDMVPDEEEGLAADVFARCLNGAQHEARRALPEFAALTPQPGESVALAGELRAAMDIPAEAIGRLNRDYLGELVRKAWVKWAETQPNPKPSWLVPYADLSEPDKEADRQIGVDLARIGANTWVTQNRFLLARILAALSHQEPDAGAVERLREEHAFDRQNWMEEIQSLRKHIQEHEIPPELEVQRLRSALATIAAVQFASIGADGQLRVMKEVAKKALAASSRAALVPADPAKGETL